ncbi:Rha family transcriptional regulator [Salmonella enterica]|nr:Rha family transcriptional regulator [Salmonella enterica]
MMSSRSIARTVDKEHKQVVRDIKTLLEQLGVYGTDLHHDDSKGFLIIKKEYNGRTVIDEIWLNEDLSITLVTGYDPKRRLGIISQWRVQKEELAQLRISVQPEPQPAFDPVAALNPDFMTLTRTVTEATASAMMKTILENTGIQAIVHVNATVSAPPATGPVIIHQQDDEKPVDDGEYVPIHKVSWATGLTDSTCRRLVDFSALPNGYVNGVRGLCVHYAIFMTAVRALIDESTPPTGKRKRWQHPEFGGFSLRKDPLEIFGEGNA